MGHGKNRQKNQKVGLGQAPKETKEQRRKRLEDEAKAKEDCLKLLPYALGFVGFIILVFAIWVHSIPPKMVSEITLDPSSINAEPISQSFEDRMAAEMANAAASGGSERQNKNRMLSIWMVTVFRSVDIEGLMDTTTLEWLRIALGK
eukprot:g2845.t1 g2845   contig12:910327-910979(+)